ncbi:glycosyltransferase family 2 protein [Nocardioides sp.]|uniref:glycosyltransferase family 2 protein n=1 Tax=Nocardioides sp. TaxID=35761 RepID=UPI00286DB359|nr:glycosyltransferase family 2 protein [Nocardioides sp.]
MIDKPRAQLGQLSWVVREYASWERLRRQALVARRMEMPNLPRSRRHIGEVWGVAMVRDELDVIGATLDHLLNQGVDRVLVADNGSVDGTRELLEERARDDDRVLVGVDPIVAYYQAEKMTWLAHRAWRAGADWVIPFDADEWWFAESGGLADHLRSRSESVINAHLHHMVPREADPADLARADFVLDATPGQVGKVAFRSHPLARVERGNHAVSRVGRVGSSLHIAHAIYRGPSQVMRKVRQGTQAAELTGDDITELTPHWASASAHGDDEVIDMWARISRGEPEPRLGFDANGPMVQVRPGTWTTWDPDGVLAGDHTDDSGHGQ